jgi:catecholate siderophore receptor
LLLFYDRFTLSHLKNFFARILFISLAIFWLAAISQSGKTFAASLEEVANAGSFEEVIGLSSGIEETLDGVAKTISKIRYETYNIPGGSMSTALEQYVKQSGIDIDFDATELEGITTIGVKGTYSAKRGLAILLRESGMQAVKQASLNPIASSYIIQKAAVAAASRSTKDATVLPGITVAEDIDYGYQEPNLKSNSLNKGQDILVLNTPMSITTISEKQIADRAPLSVMDAVAYVPGIGISSGEGNRDALVFRGQNNTGDFYVDGVRDDVQYYRDFYNVEKIEVIKGPNALIFGRAGSGGIFNRVRKEANWNPKQELKFSGGSYDHKRMSLDTGYVLNDKVAFRMNGLYEHSRSHRKGVKVQRYGISPTVTIKPTNKTKIVIQAELFKDDRIADRGIPSKNGRPFKGGSKNTFYGNAALSPTDTNKKAISMHIDHKFNDNFKVRNRTHYAKFDKFYQNIYANSAVDSNNQVTLGGYNDQTDRENFFNQTDLLVNLNTGPIKHNIITGVEVSRQVTKQLRNKAVFGSSKVVNALDPTYRGSLSFEPYGLASGKINHSISTSAVGVYIQDHMELHPMVHITAGVRYDRFEQDARNRYDDSMLKSRDDNISPRFGVILKPLEKVSVYGSYSITHQPRGGDQLNDLTASNAALKPEKFTNMEAGVKIDVLNNLSFTTAFFQLDRTNMILSGAAAGDQILGKGSRTRGVEVGLQGQLTDKWNVLASYTYMEGSLSTNSDSNAGNTLKETPKNMYAVWNRYDVTPWFGVAFGVVGRSAMFTKEDNTVTLPSYTRVDAALYGRINKYLRAQVNIQNLFDTNYYVASHNNNNIMPGAPITARVTLIATF